MLVDASFSIKCAHTWIGQFQIECLHQECHVLKWALTSVIVEVEEVLWVEGEEGEVEALVHR